MSTSLMQNTPTHTKRDLCHWSVVALYPHGIKVNDSYENQNLLLKIRTDDRQPECEIMLIEKGWKSWITPKNVHPQTTNCNRQWCYLIVRMYCNRQHC